MNGRTSSTINFFSKSSKFLTTSSFPKTKYFSFQKRRKKKTKEREPLKPFEIEVAYFSLQVLARFSNGTVFFFQARLFIQIYFSGQTKTKKNLWKKKNIIKARLLGLPFQNSCLMGLPFQEKIIMFFSLFSSKKKKKKLLQKYLHRWPTYTVCPRWKIFDDLF